MLVSEGQSVVDPGQPSRRSATPAGWKQIIEPVKPFMDRVAGAMAAQVDAFDPEIACYARYALTNQGKQIRPALVALSAKATGTMNDSLVTLAVIIEMVHLATLVHDDIVDEAEVRRCRPTLAANWGNEISVLLGDCLFANAVKLAASFPTTEVCRQVASATNRVCSGEILQTHQRRNFSLSRAEYFKAVEMKTAELFALSCDLGAHLAGTENKFRTNLRKYGQMFGTAYQIYDDCLDVFGTEERAGKSLGTDLANGKLTLPMLVVLEKANEREQAALEEWLLAWKPEYMGQVLELMEKYEALGESRGIIYAYLDSACNALAAVPESASRAGLIALTEFLAQQTEGFGV